MQGREKLVILGASNAAGIYGYDAPEFVNSDIMTAVCEQQAYVTRGSKEILIDLTKHPRFPESDAVINAGMPGDTLVQMWKRFKINVLDESPTHVFIWPGLNDASIAVRIWHNDIGEVEKDYLETINVFSQAMKGSSDIEKALKATSYAIVGVVREMTNLLHQRGIQTFIGTIPPYSSRLAYFLEKGEPMAKLQKEGLPLVEMVNQQLRQIEGEKFTVDAYKAVVDPVTGLMKPEFSWGEQKQTASGDTLHLSDAGQVIVGVALCNKFFQTPARAIMPGGRELEWR